MSERPELAARRELFLALEKELAPRIERLLATRPYDRYLGAAEFLEAARGRFLERERPPEHLGLWLSGVAQEALLAALLRPEHQADPEAAAVFCEQLRPLLEPIVRRWLRGSPIRQVVDTHDLMQTAYHRLARHVRRNNGVAPPHLLPWLNKVVRHRAFELFRRHSRTVLLSDGQAAGLTAGERPPGDELADRDEVERLVRYMGPVTRELHQLRFHEGLGWREAGERVNLSAGAARQRWHKWLSGARAEAGVGGDSHD
jgi:RNA polymerase sigma factor (sigma-70 family)